MSPRLPRGSRVEPIRMTLLVEQRVKDRLHLIAAQSGMSASAFVEALVAHLETELTERGVPSWLPQPSPADGELPIDAA